MVTLNEVGKKMSDAANKTVKETEKLANIAKLKYDLNAKKSKLNKLYSAVGAIKYAEDVLGKPAEEGAYDQTYAEIAALRAEISETENKLAKLQSIRVCDSCGAKVQKNMRFCPLCGAKLEKEEEPAAEPETEPTEEPETEAEAETAEKTE